MREFFKIIFYLTTSIICIFFAVFMELFRSLIQIYKNRLLLFWLSLCLLSFLCLQGPLSFPCLVLPLSFTAQIEATPVWWSNNLLLEFRALHFLSWAVCYVPFGLLSWPLWENPGFSVCPIIAPKTKIQQYFHGLILQTYLTWRP